MSDQGDLLSWVPPPGAHARFDGADYSPAEDDARLTGQLARIKSLMSDGAWRTLAEIESVTGDPAASISAQLRHLRKPRFGLHIVERRTRGERAHGLYEYRVLPPGSDPLPRKRSAASQVIAELRAENARLRELLKQNGVAP